MLRTFLRRAIVGSLTLPLVILSWNASAAAANSALTTSPVAVYLSAKPGTSISTTLQVQNNGPQPTNITVKLQEFKAAGVNGEAQIISPLPGDLSATWVHFSQTSFIAAPGVWNKVTMTIDVPPTAAFGYYYAVLFTPSTTLKTTPSPGVTNTIKGANAILVLLDAHAQNEKRQLGIQQFRTDKNLYQYLPTNFLLTIRNVGNVYAAPAGDIYISRSKNGPAIATLPINSAQGAILPGSDRLFTTTWDDGFPIYQLKRLNGQVISDEHGKPVQQLHWNMSDLTKFRFGHYYARAVVVYNDGTRDIPVTAETSFWVIPWLMILILGIILSMLVLGIWTFLRLFLRGARLSWRR